MKYNSFIAMGEALGLHAATKTPREKKCRTCGAVMKSLPGTNVAVCLGVIKADDGSEKPCGNRAIATILPAKEVVMA